jgi:hypothetical protein
MRTARNLKLVPDVVRRELNILSVYMDHKQNVLRKIRSGDPARAVGRCTENMRRNKYEARVAEVYSTSGKLYAVITRNTERKMTTHFEHDFDPKKGI